MVPVVAGGARCADKMFKAMTHRVLRAPMSYFETTPLGRVLNRFTYDVEVLDIELSVAMIGIMISSSWLVSAIVVMVGSGGSAVFLSCEFGRLSLPRLIGCSAALDSTRTGSCLCCLFLDTVVLSNEWPGSATA